MRCGISAWLHKFATAAEKALATEFEHQGLTTTEEKAALVKLLLGDPDDISSKHQPFLWRTVYGSSGPGDLDPGDMRLAVCYLLFNLSCLVTEICS
jgi:hypothetical protein